MPPRHLPLSHLVQPALDFDAPISAPVETASAAIIAEPAPAEYSTRPAWIDTAGRTRTWALINPQGTQMAEITTKRDAQKLATLLSRITGKEDGFCR